MAWPPTTHQDVEDELNPVRLAHRDYYRPGYYSIGTWTGITPAAAAMAVNTAYYRPFYIGARRAFDRIGCTVTTASAAGSGGLVELALHQPAAGVPGANVLTTATASTETTGAKEFVINQTLDPGIWWVALHTLVIASSLVVVNSSEHGTPFMSPTTTPLSTTSYGGFTTTTGVSTTVANSLPVTPTALAAVPTLPLISLRAA